MPGQTPDGPMDAPTPYVAPILKCPTCGATQTFTQEQLQTYLRDGWPKHCDAIMHTVEPETP